MSVPMSGDMLHKASFGKNQEEAWRQADWTIIKPHSFQKWRNDSYVPLHGLSFKIFANQQNHSFNPGNFLNENNFLFTHMKY